MKKEDLIRAINEIDDDLLLRSEKKVSFFIRRKVEIGFTVTALACCLLIVGLHTPTTQPIDPPPVDPITPVEPPKPPVEEVVIPDYPDYINPFVAPFVRPNYNETQLAYNPNLPQFEVVFQKVDMGAPEPLPIENSGYEIQDITDLLSENTWNENIVYKELPVYKNNIDFTYESLCDLLTEVAEQLNMDVYGKIVKESERDDFGEHTMTIKAANRKYKLFVDGGSRSNISARIEFRNPIQLPKGLNNGYDASLKELNTYANFYKDKVASTFNLKDPQIRITGGTYDVNKGRPGYYRFSYIEGDSQIFDSMSKSIELGYSFEGNTIDSITINFKQNLEKLGDYPTISVGKAKALLLQGNYFGYNSNPDLKEENILKVEMVYRSNLLSDAVVPFYNFYVKTKNQNEVDSGLTTIAEYYVPAIEEQYYGNEIKFKEVGIAY